MELPPDIAALSEPRRPRVLASFAMLSPAGLRVAIQAMRAFSGMELLRRCDKMDAEAARIARLN